MPDLSKPRFRPAAAFLALFLSQAVPAARAQPAPDPGVPAAAGTLGGGPAPGGFVVSGGQQGDWGFMMGPVGAPDMNLKLIRANKDRSGAIGFMCSRKTGSMQVAIVLPGATFTKDVERDLKASVADKVANLRVVVRTDPEPGSPAVFESNGPAVPELLKAIGAVPDTRKDATMIFSDGDGHQVSFPLPQPREVATTTSAICRSWSEGGPSAIQEQLPVLPGATAPASASDVPSPAPVSSLPTLPSGPSLPALPSAPAAGAGDHDSFDPSAPSR